MQPTSVNMFRINRSDFIQDPAWAVVANNFMCDYPEFSQYSYMVPLRSVEPIPYPNVHTLFEAIMHYMCSAGVRYTYALNQWMIIYPLISCENWDTVVSNIRALASNEKIQKKKRGMYLSLCEFMLEHEITHKNISVADLPKLKSVSGIGPGCIAWCKKYFTSDNDCVEYTEICFKKGFSKLYGGKDSVAQRKKVAEEWTAKGYGRIANLMVLAIGAYA